MVLQWCYIRIRRVLTEAVRFPCSFHDLVQGGLPLLPRRRSARPLQDDAEAQAPPRRDLEIPAVAPQGRVLHELQAVTAAQGLPPVPARTIPNDAGEARLHDLAQHVRARTLPRPSRPHPDQLPCPSRRER